MQIVEKFFLIQIVKETSYSITRTDTFEAKSSIIQKFTVTQIVTLFSPHENVTTMSGDINLQKQEQV